MKKNILVLFTSLLMLWFTPLYTQQINLDRPFKAGELTLFPDIQKPNVYYYLSDKPHVGKDASGQVQFSFLKFAKTATSGTGAVGEVEGGGIVHAVIELGVTPQQLAAARTDLRRINGVGEIAGPVIYKGGTIALVSSIANPDGGMAKKVIGLGKAPVMDGHKAAVSVLLTVQGASILWESFKTSTPDMSVAFEMELTGFREPKQAKIEANFDQVYEQSDFKAALVTQGTPVLLAGEIHTAFDELRRTGAIKVTLLNPDANMEKAIEDAYGKLTKLMFEPANGNGVPNMGQLTGAAQQTSLLDRISKSLTDARKEAQGENQLIKAENARLAELKRNAKTGTTSTTPPVEVKPGSDTSKGSKSFFTQPKTGSSELSQRTTPDMKPGEFNFDDLPAPSALVSVPTLAVGFSYEMKKSRQTGIYTIELNKYSTDNLTVPFDENFGEIKCASCFKEVNLDDPLYKQRVINVFLDGMNAQDFDKYINSVTLMLRKKHQSGEMTMEEVTIDRNNFNKEGNSFHLIYGWKNDVSRVQWFKYETRVIWNFFGGYSTDSDWRPANSNSQPLTPPFQRRQLYVEGDPATMTAKGIRAIELKVFEKVGNKPESVKLFKVNPKTNQLSGEVELIQPFGELNYEYEYTWFMADGSSKPSGRKKSTNSMIFIDQM